MPIVEKSRTPNIRLKEDKDVRHSVESIVEVRWDFNIKTQHLEIALRESIEKTQKEQIRIFFLYRH